jgi:hypothetical protein
MTTTAIEHTKNKRKADLGNEEVCTQCGEQLCRRQIVLNLSLGYETEYSCISCLAQEKNQAPISLFNYLLNYIKTRPCYMIMFEKSRCDETRMLGCPYRSSCIQD